MGKAILLKTLKESNGIIYTYHVNPPLGNGFPEHMIIANKKSTLINIIFRKTEALGVIMEIDLLDELERLKDRLSFEYFHKRMNKFDPSDMNPEPFLKAIGYEL